MSIEFRDGFDAYTNTNDVQFYAWQGPSSAYNISAGRNTGYAGFPNKALSCASASGLNSQPWVTLPLGPLPSRTISHAVYYGGGTTRQGAISTLWSAGVAQCSLSYTAATSQFYIQVGGADPTGPITGGVCAGTYGPGEYYWVEWSVTLNGAASSVQVMINGVNVLTASGLNLDPAASASATVLSLGGLYPGILLIDDLIVQNTANAWLGNSVVLYCPPTADSAVGNAGWVPASGTGTSNVNGESPSTNTGDINATAAGAVSTFAFTLPAGLTGTIFGVGLKASAKFTDASSSHTLAMTYASGGTNHALASAANISSGTYAGIDQVMTVNPATSSAFVVTDITGGEFGVTLVS